MANSEPSVRTHNARGLETQRRILEAAVTALVEHGYAGASTLRIQEIAGVTRGRLLHQFPSRDDLLVAAVTHLAAARVSETGERQDWPTDPGDRIDAAVETMWSTYQTDYFWASIELWMGARHNAQLRAALLPIEKRQGRQVRDAVNHMFGTALASLSSYPSLRDLLTSSMRGVALTYTFDRRHLKLEPHLKVWQEVAREGLLARPSRGNRRAL